MIRPLRAIVIEARIDASPADVWHALTDARALADWFPRKASAQPGVGGVVEVAWDDAMAWPMTIEVWEPERHLRWADSTPMSPDAAPQSRMIIDWSISSEKGQTVLRLVNSGFGEGAHWDEQIDGVTGGWTYFLWNLEELLTRHRGQHRDLVWIRPSVPFAREAFWNALFETGFLDSSADGNFTDEACTLTLDGVSTEGVVAMAERHKRFAARFPGLGNALLFVEFEGAAPAGFHAGFWLSTYGLGAERVDALQRALAHAVEECLRAVDADAPPLAAH